MQQITQQIPYSLKYIISGIGRCGWDVLESLYNSIGLEYELFIIRFRSELMKKTSVGQIKLYFMNNRGYTNPTKLKNLIHKHGIKQIKEIHNNIDTNIYVNHEKYISNGSTGSGKNRHHMCYITNDGCGITFTHQSGPNYNSTSKPGL